VVPSQQPLGQLVGVHTQEPFWHCVPAGQPMQATPPVPQNSSELPWRHVCVASSQHPLEQLAVVHTQEPFWHSVPVGQLMHVAPPVPQNWLELPWRHVVDGPPLTPASQQPAQLAVVQTPPWHSRSAGQLMHVAPPVPQNWFESPWRPVVDGPPFRPASQQPAQLAVVQTQTPPWHSRSAGQLMHVAPPVPQNWFESPWRHVVDGPPFRPASQQPAQLAVVQTQTPPRHSSPAGQVTHATPPVPQAALVFPGWHLLF
jgi:hypothetical protein